MAIKENAEGVNLGSSVEVAGPEHTKLPEIIWPRNLTASMSRFKSLFHFRIRLTFKLIVVIVFSLLMGSAIFEFLNLQSTIYYPQSHS